MEKGLPMIAAEKGTGTFSFVPSAQSEIDSAVRSSSAAVRIWSAAL